MAVQRTFTFQDGRLLNIQPSQIPVQTDYLWNAFGKSEAENSAGHLLRFCQHKGSWEFTRRELTKFLGSELTWWGLWWEFVRPISKLNQIEYEQLGNSDEPLVVSAEFIMRCWLAILE